MLSVVQYLFYTLCLVSCLYSLSLKSLSSTSPCSCCMLWDLAVESAFALILLRFVGELPFL